MPRFAGQHTALGQPKQALELYQRALALFVELTDEPGQATAWSDIGVARTALRDSAGAAAAQRRALAWSAASAVSIRKENS